MSDSNARDIADLIEIAIDEIDAELARLVKVNEPFIEFQYAKRDLLKAKTLAEQAQRSAWDGWAKYNAPDLAYVRD